MLETVASHHKSPTPLSTRFEGSSRSSIPCKLLIFSRTSACALERLFTRFYLNTCSWHCLDKLCLILKEWPRDYINRDAWKLGHILKYIYTNDYSVYNYVYNSCFITSLTGSIEDLGEGGGMEMTLL